MSPGVKSLLLVGLESSMLYQGALVGWRILGMVPWQGVSEQATAHPWSTVHPPIHMTYLKFLFMCVWVCSSMYAHEEAKG